MESNTSQPQLPLDEEPKIIPYTEWDRDEVVKQREEHREDGGAWGDLGALAVGPPHEEKEKTHEVPKTDDGLYDIDQIEPGMYLPEWGPVKGSPSESGLDFTVVPDKFTIGQKRFHAALEFAKRENALALAHLAKDEERIRIAQKSKMSWVEYSEANKFKE